MSEQAVRMKDHVVWFYRDNTIDNGFAVARMYDDAFADEETGPKKLYGVSREDWTAHGRWAAEGCACRGQYIAETIDKGLWKPVADKKGYEYAEVPGANNRLYVFFRPANSNITKRVSKCFWERLGKLLNDKQLLAAAEKTSGSEL